MHYLLEGVMGLFLIHWDNPFASRCDYFTKSPDPCVPREYPVSTP